MEPPSMKEDLYTFLPEYLVIQDLKEIIREANLKGSEGDSGQR